jgi:hypothetical protein
METPNAQRVATSGIQRDRSTANTDLRTDSNREGIVVQFETFPMIQVQP